MAHAKWLAVLIAIVAGTLAYTIFRGLWGGFESDETPALVGRALPSLPLETLKGEKLASGSLTKDSKTLIALWATWCEPCTRELPVLQRLRPQIEAAGTKVILVNADGGEVEIARAQVSAWLIAKKISLPNYFDFADGFLNTLKIPGLPFAIGTDAKGIMRYASLGEMDWEQEWPAVLQKLGGLH